MINCKINTVMVLSTFVHSEELACNNPYWDRVLEMEKIPSVVGTKQVHFTAMLACL
jgi:hypothetical protein